jgi:hypothetical protein
MLKKVAVALNCAKKQIMAVKVSIPLILPIIFMSEDEYLALTYSKGSKFKLHPQILDLAKNVFGRQTV